MALWQYTFHVFPNTFQNISSLNHYEKDEEGYYDDSIFWKENQVTEDFFSDMGKILPLTPSWAKQRTQYGDLDSHCCEILWDNDGIIISVSFRIHYTIEYEDVLREIIELLLLKGMAILDENFTLVDLNFEAIKSVIENSEKIKKYNWLVENQDKK